MKRLLQIFLNFLVIVMSDDYNINIVTYGHMNLELGRTVVNSTTAGLAIAQDTLEPTMLCGNFSVSFSFDVLTKRTLKDCNDAEASAYMVSEYYYEREWDDNNVMVMVTPGKFGSRSCRFKPLTG